MINSPAGIWVCAGCKTTTDIYLFEISGMAHGKCERCLMANQTFKIKKQALPHLNAYNEDCV